MFPTSLIKQTFSPPDGRTAERSKRLRLWELPWHVHCPVVGVCLPLPMLRRLAVKAAPELSACDDYTLHSAVVQRSRTRNAVSEAIQDALEQRHAIALRNVRKLRDHRSLSIWWNECVSAGDIAGPLWAVISHPACDAEMAEGLSQQMHMIQHQAGASLRMDIQRFHALQEENIVLANSLATAQQRAERCTQEKSSELDRLNSELIRLRAQLISKTTEIEGLQVSLQALQSVAAERDARERLAQQLAWQEDRCNRLTLENARLSKALSAAQTVMARPQSGVTETDATRAEESASLHQEAEEATLDGHRILCVGGRESTVVIYRKLVEQAGGKFIHHDGGIEDRFGQLDTALSAADLVICQTGCISHNAYWRVKDHCKRTGKRCAFVETPSAAGLARGLHELLKENN